MEILADIAIWCLMSIVKFLVTPSIMVGLDYSVLFTICVTSLGAAIGVQIFYYMGRMIFKWLDGRKGKKKEKIVTPMKRKLVAFKNDYGLMGLLFISGIISVPIAAVLVAKYFDKYKTAPWLLTAAFVIWSVVLTVASNFIKSGNLF
jgi:membrane protein YqaA with SNARE-associated domain